MWTYHPELLAPPVPRYTSYPTAAEFHDRISAADMAAGLDAIAPATPVSLYLHIPFCREICWYCGCNTGAANRSERLEAYVDRMIAEVEMVAARLAGRGRVARIAFGGGSPNALAAPTFARLADATVAAFACRDAEVSVEIDPRGFDSRWAAAIVAAGVSRVSLGVQSLAPQVQAAIGRIQPLEVVARIVGQLRDAGVRSLNFDLMYGLPRQLISDLDETLSAAIALQPDRIAVFGYAHMPSAIPRQRRIDGSQLPGPAARFAQAAHAHGQLTNAGYAAIGFDHFARPHDPLARAAAAGRLRRNFQGFADDPAEVLIGFGASAISEFPDRLLQNEKNNGRYHMAVAAGRFATTRGVLRSAADRAHARAIADVLTLGQTDVANLPEPSRRHVIDALDRFEAARLLSWSGSVVSLAPAALPYARTIAAAFDAYRGGSQPALSRAV